MKLLSLKPYPDQRRIKIKIIYYIYIYISRDLVSKLFLKKERISFLFFWSVIYLFVFVFLFK